MILLGHSLIYIFLFISLYFEVFLLTTYIENYSQINHENTTLGTKLSRYPRVAIMVPCWNEETTISKTLHSLLNLDYPKDKLEIIVIDDGSTDNTWQVIQKFATYQQIRLFHTENQGKYKALNFGLTQSTSEMVGCLDADSYVTKDTLTTIVRYFENKEVMAVTPSVKIFKPKNPLQLIQSVEYNWGVFTRKLFSYLGALYVTPGPFSIFRRTVFNTIGGYRHAHNTEDMELAMRMQSHHMKIANAHNAHVYTIAPPTLRKLYKQRLRWTYGFIKNAIDYRYIFFKKEYGNLGVYILPMASISIVSSVYVLSMTIFSLISRLFHFLQKIQIVGFDFHIFPLSFSLFSINTEFIALASTIAFFGTVTMIFISRKMATGKTSIGMDMVYFLTLYGFIAPVWLAKAVFNAIFSIKTSWR